MIRVTHGTLKMLRAGRVETVTIPCKPPRPGAAAPLPPCVADCEYLLLAPESEEFKREKLRALAISVERTGDSWRVAFRSGVGIETPRFLRARPGGDDGDYTTVESRAASHEPEPVDAQWLCRFEADARSAETIREDWSRDHELRDIDALIAKVEARGLDTDRSYLQKLRAARRQLAKAAA